jgi:type I restriction enzyme, S subunit
MSSEVKTTTVEKEDKPALTPKLRFPEFQDAEGWTGAQLITLSKVSLSNGVFNDPTKTGTGYKLINVSDMYIDTTIVENRLSLLELSVSEFETNQVEYGDIFFTRSSLVKSGIAVSNIYLGESRDVTFDGHLIRFRPNTNKVVPIFTHYLFKTAQIRAQLVARGKSATMTTIGQADVGGVSLHYPKKYEQQKIADCLTSVDELIAAQAGYVDALKTNKKGLMQQLFPREGETQPRLRFPEFQDAGEWGEKTMGSIASFSSGGTPSKDNPEYWNGTIPWVSASSMYDLVIEKADHYVTPLAIGNGTRIAKKGSILILVRGSMLFKRVPICVAGIDVAFNQDVKALDVDASINTGFLLYQLSAFQSRMPINETGIGAGKIELDHLKEFELFIPEETEQQRIADCLTSLDDLISTQTQKLAALKTHKKGLMQQLFPSPDEVDA